MESLEANITTTCPNAFGGITGELFLKAVTAVVAAHCSIFDDYAWPPDNADEVIQMRSSKYTLKDTRWTAARLMCISGYYKSHGNPDKKTCVDPGLNYPNSKFHSNW